MSRSGIANMSDVSKAIMHNSNWQNKLFIQSTPLGFRSLRTRSDFLASKAAQNYKLVCKAKYVGAIN